jgi:hypothetical protein
MRRQCCLRCWLCWWSCSAALGVLPAHRVGLDPPELHPRPGVGPRCAWPNLRSRAKQAVCRLGGAAGDTQRRGLAGRLVRGVGECVERRAFAVGPRCAWPNLRSSAHRVGLHPPELHPRPGVGPRCGARHQSLLCGVPMRNTEHAMRWRPRWVKTHPMDCAMLAAPESRIPNPESPLHLSSPPHPLQNGHPAAPPCPSTTASSS